MVELEYLSPNYNSFDQLLHTVKNKTTVLILVLKEFLQTSFPPLISVHYAKGITIFRGKIFVSHCRNVSSRNPSVFQIISGIEKLYA